MKKYTDYIPLVITGVIVLISFINGDTLFYNTLKSIFLSETALGWFLTCFMFIWALFLPFFLMNSISRWCCFLLSLFMIINTELIFSMWAMAAILNFHFTNSTFGVFTVFGFTFAILLMKKTSLINKREMLLLIVATLGTALVASYWMVITKI